MVICTVTARQRFVKPGKWCSNYLKESFACRKFYVAFAGENLNCFEKEEKDDKESHGGVIQVKKGDF